MSAGRRGAPVPERDEGMAMTMASAGDGAAWLARAHDDVDQWAAVMDADADGRPVDWAWLRTLDFAHGVGAARDEDLEPGAGSDVHGLLKRDYAVRDRLEAVLAQCGTAFMRDFDRLIASYRLPRAIAYANRRLCDEIALLMDRGVTEGLWTVAYERRGRVTVPVLHAAQGAPPVDDIQDATAEIADARAARRRSRGRSGAPQARAGVARAGAASSGVPADGTSGGAAGASGTDESAHGAPAADGASAKTRGRGGSDWRDAYLPGRGVDAVMGIDIETTGVEPMRDYIIDVGFEYMNMASPRPSEADAQASAAYVRDGYRAGDAYGQSRLPFGVPAWNARHGNPTILELTGIDVRGRAGAPYRLFDEWPEAQRGLLVRLERQPYVAHNANFEHRFFMLNVAGYAESYRAGRITIIDTMPMSRRWDPGSAPGPEHPYGDNSLQSYARRQGALPEDERERHLGLEDAHIMLLAMKRHLAALREERRGPWGPDGRSGVGGKRCGGRRR